jgi:hypothetical protein
MVMAAALAVGGTTVLGPGPVAAVQPPVDVVRDGSFEAATGSPLRSPEWTMTDSASTSTTPGILQSSGGLARTGSVYANFDGYANNRVETLSQSVTIPAGASATLGFWVLWSGGGTAITVLVDGTSVDRWDSPGNLSSYAERVVDLGAYASGTPHQLTFRFTTVKAGYVRAYLDDVRLTTVAPDPAPETTLTTTPKAKVTTARKKTRVSFAFASSIAGSTFACALDGKPVSPCAPGMRPKVGRGSHVFTVAATAAGVTDPTPATYQFAVKRKRRH